jgi:phosphoribosylformimino-5-aminoimidazole carboxamide ribotide isomerase
VEIIPVIDLKGGLVVHARRGDRCHYAPLASRLCDSCEPLAIARALVDTHPVRTLYVADLDAITGAGDHNAVLQTLLDALPHIAIWLDAGFTTPDQIESTVRAARIIPVLGSESISNVEHYLRLRAIAPGAILSLDRRGDAVLGPLVLTEQPALWPARVIHLDLARVGAGEGPDLAGIERLHSLSPGTALYAGGGVRGVEDLRALRHAGARGALVATALHDGSLSARDPGL